METGKNYLIEHMIKNLDDVGDALNKLSDSAAKTNENIFDIKLRLVDMVRDIKGLKEAPPLTYRSPIIDIFHDEMRKIKVDVPKKTRDILLWIIAIMGSTMTIILGIDKLIN